MENLLFAGGPVRARLVILPARESLARPFYTKPSRDGSPASPMHFDLRFSALLAAPVLALSLAACGVQDTAAPAEPQPVADLRILSADDMEGRLVGSEGNARAREYLIGRLSEIGVTPVFEKLRAGLHLPALARFPRS